MKDNKVFCTASMTHTKDTIYRLSQTQYSSFHFSAKVVQALIGIALILYGLYGDSQLIMPMVCLLIGCMLVVSLDIRARMRASAVIKAMEGTFPSSQYTFYAGSFAYYDQGTRIPYGNLIRLVEDRSYLYLYISTDSAYMVDKNSLIKDELTGLKSLLVEKTGLRWRKPFGLLNFSIREWISANQELKDRQLR